MLVSPELRELIQSTIRTESQLQRMDVYGGVRGLGIAGSAAFGLAVGLALQAYIMQRYFMLNSKMSSLTAFVFWSIALLASLSAGRTAILGFLAGFVLYAFYKTDGSIFKKLTKHSIYIAGLVALLITYVLSNPNLQELITRYWSYALNFFVTFLMEGDATSSSLGKLESMYFIPSLDNLLLGDGRYTGLDGNYYMRTDPGYMRMLLLIGPLGSAIMYTLFLILTLVTVKTTQTKHQSHGIFFIGIVALAFFFHYKGEVIFTNVLFMKLFFFVALSLWLKASVIRDEESNG